MSMIPISNKGKRSIEFAVDRLIKPTSFTKYSYKDTPILKVLSRRIRLEENREIYFSDSGYQHFRKVIEVLYSENYFENKANFSDIGEAWREVIKSWFAKSENPKNADEIINEIAMKLGEKIDTYTFVVPVCGAEMLDRDELTLGKLKMMRHLSLALLNDEGVKHEHANVEDFTAPYKSHVWLMGSVIGTYSVAKETFASMATLEVGLLAIFAAAIYSRGATSFRVGVVLNDSSFGNAHWVSWSNTNKSLNRHAHVTQGQGLPILETEHESYFDDFIRPAYQIIHKDSRNEIEEAITKAIYWFSDAQRDSVQVMSFIKYWSCIEVFFSFEKKEITESVSKGLAAILVFGGIEFIEVSEYNKIKKQIVKFYRLRSKALHSASHQHITESDNAKLSQWIAWLIIIMIDLTLNMGYTKLTQLKKLVSDLDEQSKKKITKES